tara:strand:- start:233 stop:424 length:192 start_codon:yes stop_codon:yes gene_type:complete
MVVKKSEGVLEKKEIIFPVYLPDVFCNSNWSLFDDIKAISTPEKKAANNKVTIASKYIINFSY